MHNPQISKFYLANLKTQPFFEKLDRHVEPGGGIEKLHNTFFLGHLQVLFYARHPIFQLLFSEPGNAPIFERFDWPVAPRGGVEFKKLNKTQSSYWL